VPVLLKFTA